MEWNLTEGSVCDAFGLKGWQGHSVCVGIKTGYRSISFMRVRVFSLYWLTLTHTHAHTHSVSMTNHRDGLQTHLTSARHTRPRASGYLYTSDKNRLQNWSEQKGSRGDMSWLKKCFFLNIIYKLFFKVLTTRGKKKQKCINLTFQRKMSNRPERENVCCLRVAMVYGWEFTSLSY